MTVVSNTSPLCYLVLIQCEGILPKLFGSVHVTQAVISELLHADAPAPVQKWAASLPHWIQLHPSPPESDTTLSHLDLGERSAILLAEQLRADQVLMDERAARTMATQRGLKVAGVLGVLKEAADARLIDLTKALDEIRKTNFRVSPDLLRALYAHALRG